MISAPGEPRGSRVITVRSPNDRSRAPSSDAWVDLPVPSPPSKVMKRPGICPPLLLIVFGSIGRRLLRTGGQTGDLYPFGGRAKQLDHKFRSGIDGALRNRACGHTF